MTQPIDSSSRNFTPYDPSLQQSRADGGAGGASGTGPVASGGAEGAASVSNQQPPAEASEAPACVGELVKAVTDCGKAYLSHQSNSPSKALDTLSCLAAIKTLYDCARSESPPKKAP